MNEKITLQDLITLFSEKQGMTKKDSEFFIKGLFDLIEEVLATERYVKVKGLGTFKLTEVESRESVHIHTGERIEIQGHTKISFTPDSIMKDLINKPFAHFEAVVLNDGVELEDTPVESVTDETPIIEETQPEPIEETPAPIEETVQEIPMAEEPIIEEPITEEPIVEIQTEEPVQETTEEVAPVIETVPVEAIPVVETEIQEEAPIEEPQPEPVMVETKEEEPQKPVFIEEKVVTDTKEKNINRILWGVIVVLVLIILFGAYWMFLRPSDTHEVMPVTPVQEETVTAPTPVADEKPQEETLKTIEFIELSAEELRKERVPSFADTLDCQIVGTQKEYTLQKGETIIRASVKFFGTKKYWPYIVKHNLDVLPDPDNIPAGVKIKIPVLTPKKQTSD